MSWWQRLSGQKRRTIQVLLILCVVIASLIARLNWLEHREDFQDALLNSSLRGELEVVRQLLASGENPNKQDGYGNSPLTVAAYAGQTNVLNELLRQGATLEQPDKSGMTPLLCAAYHNQNEAVRFLLAHGANPNAQDSYGYSPLHFGAARSIEMTEVMLQSGASVTNQTQHGWHPLHCALTSSELKSVIRLRIVQSLLKHGADTNAKLPREAAEEFDGPFPRKPGLPNHGTTPLELARSNGFVEIATLLLHQGAK